jgi:hypothetical protein
MCSRNHIAELSPLYSSLQVKKIHRETEGERNRCADKYFFHSFHPSREQSGAGIVESDLDPLDLLRSIH